MENTFGKQYMSLAFRSMRRYCGALVILVLLWIGFHAYVRLFRSGNSKTVKNGVSERNSIQLLQTPKLLRIYTWNGMMDGPNGPTPWLREGLVTSQTHPSCKLKRQHSCIYLHGNRSYYDTSEAVLFKGHHWALREPKDIPTFRPTGQKWLHFIQQPHTQVHDEFIAGFHHQFNITITFKFDSDVHTPYGPSCSITKTNLERILKNQTEVKIMTEKVKKKTGLVAWFVSHCRTPAGRENYVRELMRHVPVDIYGKCGNLTCKKKIGPYASCDAMIDGKYKFYLSFENSLCQDYVTEKFFRINEMNTVAIVRGAVNYTRFAPLGTYIDVRDFPSAKELAQYLKLLDSRSDLYVKFLLRKRAMTCQPLEQFGCQLCRYLHEHAYLKQRVDLAKFWNKTKQCKTEKEFTLSMNKGKNLKTINSDNQRQ